MLEDVKTKTDPEGTVFVSVNKPPNTTMQATPAATAPAAPTSTTVVAHVPTPGTPSLAVVPPTGNITIRMLERLYLYFIFTIWSNMLQQQRNLMLNNWSSHIIVNNVLHYILFSGKHL
jgi:hypothetical protein